MAPGLFTDQQSALKERWCIEVCGFHLEVHGSILVEHILVNRDLSLKLLKTVTSSAIGLHLKDYRRPKVVLFEHSCFLVDCRTLPGASE